MTDSMTLSTDTDGTTDDRQHVVKPAVFLTHIPNRNFNIPSTSIWAKGSQKTNFGLPVFFHSLQRTCRR